MPTITPQVLRDAIAKISDQYLLVAFLLCIALTGLATLLFSGNRSSALRLLVFLLVAAFFVIIYRLAWTLAAPQQKVVEAKADEIVIPGTAYRDGEHVARAPLPNVYGQVLMNAPPFQNAADSATFDLCAAAEGTYRLCVRLAAGEPRPVDVIVNGETKLAGTLNQSTGGFLQRNQMWIYAGAVDLHQGGNSLQLRSSNNSVFPHISFLKLTPVSALPESDKMRCDGP